MRTLARISAADGAAADPRRRRKRPRPALDAGRSLAEPASPPPTDPESRVHDDHHETLRLWLRLLTCTRTIEGRVRTRLREDFATTLPRFDLMAQLERNPSGLKMGELSRRLMVTGGNVTGITDQLVAEGLVRREPIAGDRRAYAVRLTPRGKRMFDAMAVEHERWIEDLLSGLKRSERGRLHTLLGRLKTTIHECAGPSRARTAPSPGGGGQRRAGSAGRDAVPAPATGEKRK